VSALTPHSTPDLETPAYLILKRMAAYEVREYPPMVIAEADTSMSMSETDSKRTTSSTTSAFQTLAGYIFGANSTNTKMAMTTPVFTQLVDTQPSTMQFVMPSTEVCERVHVHAACSERSVHPAATDVSWRWLAVAARAACIAGAARHHCEAQGRGRHSVRRAQIQRRRCPAVSSHTLALSIQHRPTPHTSPGGGGAPCRSPPHRRRERLRMRCERIW
jgi:hypothetical protein